MGGLSPSPHHPLSKLIAVLIKKKIKFSSYIRKFRVEQLQSHIYEGLLNRQGNAQIIPHI
jgi:hypothetical protein